MGLVQYPFSESVASLGSSLSLENPDDTDTGIIPRRVYDSLGEKGFEVNKDGKVTFKPNSTSHPRKWPLHRKVWESALICFLEFFMTLMSNTGATVAAHAQDELRISRVPAIFCFTTVYLFGQAIGGLVLGPVAESFGHRTIYVASTAAFAAACLLIALAHDHLAIIIVGRFVSGLTSAIPATVAAGSIENMWDEKARITLVHTWISGAVLGLGCGPSVATYLSTSSLGWPWIFYVAAIVSCACAFACLGMHESRPSQVLRQNVQVVARETGYSHLSTDSEHHLPSVSDFLRTTLTQPVRLFCTEPVLFWVSIMGAVVYCNLYLFSEALTVVYAGGFGMTEREASLVFLALGVGIVPTFLPRVYDIKLANQRRRDNLPMEVEDKLFGFYVAAPVLAIGLWWFAWTVPPLVTSITPWSSIASLILIGYATVEFDTVLSGYLTDTYMNFAASANAPMAFLRAVLSGVSPLFGRQMFQRLGSNMALFILAGVATLFCCIAIWMKLQAKHLRLRSPFAEKTALSAQSSERCLTTKEATAEA